MRSDASTQRGIICPEEDAMPQPDGHHARLVYSVIRGASPDAAAPEHVRRSWQRCLDEYGLDPESKAQPVLVSHQELLVRKEQNLELVSLADAEMAHLRSEEHTSELQSRLHLVCRLLLEKKKKKTNVYFY